VALKIAVTFTIICICSEFFVRRKFGTFAAAQKTIATFKSESILLSKKLKQFYGETKTGLLQELSFEEQMENVKSRKTDIVVELIQKFDLCAYKTGFWFHNNLFTFEKINNYFQFQQN